MLYIYNPPSKSSYTNNIEIDYMEILERDITHYSGHGEVIIGGDLNARNCNLKDFITHDSGDHILLYYDYSSDLDINVRHSMDRVVSTMGRQLIEICIQSGLRILNGRILGDSVRKYTSLQPLGSSVIYFFKASESLSKHIPNFKVQSFQPDLSDHCQISMSLRVNCCTPIFTLKLENFPEKIIWNKDLPIKFRDALVTPDVKQNIDKFLDEGNLEKNMI